MLLIFAFNVDRYIYEKIQEYRNPYLDKTMSFFSYLGSRDAGLIFCSITLFGNDYMRDTGKLMATSILISQGATSIMKFIVNRKRPDGESDRWNSSFPSGHASGIFGVSYIISKRYPESKIYIYSLATIVSISRIYLGRHYPSDVVVGSALGILSGFLSEKLIKIGGNKK